MLLIRTVMNRTHRLHLKIIERKSKTKNRLELGMEGQPSLALDVGC